MPLNPTEFNAMFAIDISYELSFIFRAEKCDVFFLLWKGASFCSNELCGSDKSRYGSACVGAPFPLLREKLRISRWPQFPDRLTTKFQSIVCLTIEFRHDLKTKSLFPASFKKNLGFHSVLQSTFTRHKK